MKKINFKKYFSTKNAIFISLLLVTIFLLGNSVLAADWVNNAIGGIIGVLINGVTKILILLVNVLIVVASYSDFIHAEAVTKGWVVVRDICNMFFVVVLLVIAFATILGQEEFSAKKNLPKLIMAAVLINFSKMFCGIMIDIANVVMLTFVNAFKEIGSANMIDMLGISDVLRYGQSGEAPSLASTVTAYIFGLIYVLIATVVVASMLAMLVMRIVMMWIYIVLSPAAFFLQAVPGKGQQYASQWWSKWTSNLIVGPVLAFFLWLSFAALQSGGSPLAVSDAGDQQASSEANPYVMTESSTEQDESIDSKAGSVSGFAKFAIAIGMLLGGMKIAQEVGGETGSVLGKGMNAINKGKAMAISGATRAAKSVGRGVGRGAGRVALGAVSLADKKLSGSTGDNRKTWAGKLAKGWGDDLQAGAKKRRKEAASGYLKKLGMGEKSSEAGQQVIDSEGFQKTVNIAKGAGIGLGTAAVFGASLPLSLGVAAVGGGIGYVSRKRRGKRKENVKDYEKTQGDYGQAQRDEAGAKVELDAAQTKFSGHEKVVSEFDTAKNDMAKIKAQKVITTSDKAVYDEKEKFVNNPDNIKNYQDSTDYLKNNNDIATAQQKIQNSQLNVSQLKTKLDDGKDQYEKDKSKIKNSTILDSFSGTRAAMSDNTKVKDAAKAKVKNQANDPDYWQDKNATRYPSTGLRKADKEELSIYNAGGAEADTATANLMASIPTMPDNQAEQWAKALAALEYKDDVKLNPDTLGKVKEELKKKTQKKAKASGANYEFNSDNLKDKVSLDYKEFDKNKMVHNEGAGKLQFDAFAKNSAKAPVDRNSAKDVMGVSFAKYNEKAKQLGIKELQKDAGGVNADSAESGELSKVMSGLIDDEIKTLQAVSASVSADAATKLEAASKIGQLTTAKSRLDSGKVSNLSLKNSDISYQGVNDSEKRRAEYNTTQHETMHKAGAKNEELVDQGAEALQSSKLVGSIPNSSGQRYDQEIGKLIASMEQASASQEAIKEAIAGQIEKWQVPNAQRVVEIENNQRETVKDVLLDPEEKVITTEAAASPDNSRNVENFEKAIDKMTTSLNKSFKPVSGKPGAEFKLSTVDKDFLRKLSIKSDKIGEGIANKLKPLGVMAASEEKRRNP